MALRKKHSRKDAVDDGLVVEPVDETVEENDDTYFSEYDTPDENTYSEGGEITEDISEIGEEFKDAKKKVSKREQKSKAFDEVVARYGLDPVKAKRTPKTKDSPSLRQLINPKNLQREVEKYGYKFNANSFYLSLFATMAVAIGVGFLFQLKWYFIAIIVIAAALSVPSIIYTTHKNMYESKRFHDVTNYLEQLLYSFRKKQKILTALEDVQMAFEGNGGPMYKAIGEAINYIRNGTNGDTLFKEALSFIEAEYDNDRIRNAHNFLIAVERNGGKVENPVGLLLEDRAMWDERIHTFQKDRSNTRRHIVVSLMFSLILCFFILYILSTDRLAELEIAKNTVVQISSTAIILLDMWMFSSTTKKLSKGWLSKEKKHSDYQIIKDYFYVMDFDKPKEIKTSLLCSLIPLVFVVVGLVLSKYVLTVIGVAGIALCMGAPFISLKLSKKSTTREIEKTFPQWLMELALILQADNVQVAISKTLTTAPVVLRPALYELVEGFEENPQSIQPYNNFLNDYDLPEIKSAMRMLYSITTTGTGDMDEQITDLIKKQNILMDKAEKIANDDQLAAFSTLTMLPMLFCIFKSVVDMTILVFSLFSMIHF
ncbi:MAG: hypothetical protein UGF89_01590 [Acutalibacteraceae bacterium]|nr:hypothetical protein [Acutalibacteraceae bacterium]